jgi:hypothetical protein
MPFVFKEAHRPLKWKEYRSRGRAWSRPFLMTEWLAEWAAFFLGKWVLLEVLEYCGTLSIVVGVIFYFAGAHDRLEQKHYQAWQVINTAQGKGGSGGRIDALQELNTDKVPLVGVDIAGAFLQNVNLPLANLRRASMSKCDMRGAMLQDARLQDADLHSTNLRGAHLDRAMLDGADLSDADLNGAFLNGANLNDVTLDRADLRGADLAGIANWQSIASINLTNVLGIKNAPDGFLKWATGKGAVQCESDDQWEAQIKASTQPATSP